MESNNVTAGAAGEQVVAEWKLRARNWRGFDLPDYQAKVLTELITVALAAAQQPLVDALHKMLKAVNDFADEESTDIIYGELRKEVELLIAKAEK